jgi:archaellum component FlaG (FlaF/FlaG flagellin family)
MKSSVNVGDRVQLVYMNDSLTKLSPGDMGTVVDIDTQADEETLIWVDWDNGEHLALLSDTDKYKVIRG